MGARLMLVLRKVFFVIVVSLVQLYLSECHTNESLTWSEKLSFWRLVSQALREEVSGTDREFAVPIV